MARIWTEPFNGGMIPMEYWGHGRTPHAPTLLCHQVLKVRVASFTFQFVNLQQLRECLNYYQQKVRPSSRRRSLANSDHWEYQRWFERLPMHLLEDPKRQKVVEALHSALQLAETPGFFAP